MREKQDSYLAKDQNQRVRGANDIIGKLPAQAVDIEEAVLGAMMLEPHCISNVAAMLSDDVFYKDVNQIIYSSVINLYEAGKTVDILTVTNEIRSLGKLEIVGGPFYITSLTSRIASSANIEQHAAILLQKYLMRELSKFSGQINVKSYSDEDAFDLMDEAETMLAKIGEISARAGSFIHIAAAAEKATDDIRRRERMRKEGKVTGIDTGLKELNQLITGWQPSTLNVLAARPGMGKTALMLHFAKSAAKAGTPVCIYSLEMSDEMLAKRLILSETSLDPTSLKRGNMTPEEWDEYLEAKSNISRLPIHIDANPVVSMRYIKSNSRVMHRKGKCEMVMIDYLQLSDMSTGDKGRNREQEVAQASRQAKIIAKELNVPVILLSQLSREVEKRGSKKPQLSDLRESGAIEQDADTVIFIYRPEYYGIETDDAGNTTRGNGILILEKNRDGSVDDIPFSYNESMTRITDYESGNSLTPYGQGEPLKPNSFFDSENEEEIF